VAVQVTAEPFTAAQGDAVRMCGADNATLFPAPRAEPLKPVVRRHLG
jgi:hypothetical protein